MNLEYTEINANKRIAVGEKLRPASHRARDRGVWKYALAAMWALDSAAVSVSALGMPTGLGRTFDIAAALVLNAAGMALAAWIVAVLLALARADRMPRLTSGAAVYTSVLAYFVLYFSELGWKASLVFALIVTSVAAGIGLLAGFVVGKGARVRRIALGALAVATALAFLPEVSSRLAGGGSADDADAAADAGDSGALEVRASAMLPSDPSQPGSYAYRQFTYASGEDKHRAEFGKEAELLSSSVDASAYIDSWPWLRRQFWGFDETALPLNGRVWLPEGDGPYPIVLMVHGNHLMEDFSDEGYGYLGELLASRGIAAVSVDENFFNYSVWSGIPEQDMKLRAWLLLQHIRQLQSYSERQDTPFYGRIDFNRIALLGHSRGGQAAAMAADASRWFADDPSLPERGSYEIEAVIALAPTDTEVDGERPRLQDISYLTLQGAKDTDLVSFYGDRQYGRADFSGVNAAFKASLYIEDANHSQFNTTWGRSDNAMPAGLFIRPKSLLPAEDQRRIAKTYVSAFAEAVFHGSEEYNALFRDYRAGSLYLPDTRYFNQFENGDFRQLIDFSGEDPERPSTGATAEASGLTEWQHADTIDRQGEDKAEKGVELGWQEEGSYSIVLGPVLQEGPEEEDHLMFSLANTSRALEADYQEEDAEELAALEEALGTSLSIDIELEDSSGNSARLPLDLFMEAEPPAEPEFTWLPALEPVLANGKFKDTEEPVYQTYELPLKEFVEENPDFDLSEWQRITFHFNEGPGKVMLDSVGLMAG
ncbi:alpha/beta hydrolase [Cohnella cellulosilytica]|uniref:Alpha/beta hydrolase n=1 Tax=Cohnella cellulosilytica TaxID=986710 RepID=A0ABW2FDP5_9BACL